MSSCSSVGLPTSAITDEQAAVASLWRALVVRCFKVLELGRDVGLA